MIGKHTPIAHLNDFLLGKLPDEDHAAVEAHLCDCEACVTKAAEVVSADTLGELLIAANTRIERQRSVVATPAPLTTPSVCALTGEFIDPSATTAEAHKTPTGLADHPRYRLLRPIGVGGMGSVWLAEHLVLDRQVALKVIRPEFLAHAGATERFRRESRAVAKLSHPNIVAAFDAEEVGGTHFLVMEYVAGENLSDVLGMGPLPLAAACRAARDVARGLAHAHEAGLAHRDIKPSNLIRTPDGVTKILDFGLATAEVGSTGALTGENIVVGTPDYIAPEQADAHNADARVDVYSLGCTLFHLLTGHVPFQASSVLKKLDAHRFTAPPVVPVAPPELAALVGRMMAKKPEERPSLGEIERRLTPFVDAVPQAEAAPIGNRSRVRKWLMAAGVLFVLASLAAGGAVYKIQRDRQEVTIETDDPDIEVVVRRNGEVVRIADTKTKKAWELDTTKMRLTPDGSELSIDLPDKEPLVIRRQGDRAAIIRRKPSPTETTEPSARVPVSKVELLCRIPFVYGGWHDFSPDGKEFVVWTYDDQKQFAVIFDTETGKEKVRVPLPFAKKTLAVWFLPGSTDLLVSADYQLFRWGVKTGKKASESISLPQGVVFLTVRPSADGKRFAVVVDDLFGPRQNGVIVYELGSKIKEAFRVKPLRVGSILCLYPTFSPDGKLLATVDSMPGASAVRLWDANGKLVKAIDLKQTATGSVEFGRGGREIKATYSDDKNGPGMGPFVIGTWDATTAKQLHSSPVSLEGAGISSLIPVNDLAFVYLGAIQTVRFTSTRTGELTAVYPTRGQFVSGIASRDGRYCLLVIDSELHLLRLPLVDPESEKP